MHVDDFIDTPILPREPNREQINYARWMLMHFRMSALMKMDFDPFIKGRKLFATYEGKRYRVTGASRLGDVWLQSDFTKDEGYEKRVDVEACSNWGAEPRPALSDLDLQCVNARATGGVVEVRSRVEAEHAFLYCVAPAVRRDGKLAISLQAYCELFSD